MNHPFSEDDIIRFIRGELTEEERTAFDVELNSNQSLVDEVKSVGLSLSAIDAGGEQLLRERFKTLEKKNAIKKWTYALLLAIAVVAIGLALKKGFTKEDVPEMKAIYAKNFQKYRPPVTIRNEDDQKSNMSAAIESYNASDYQKAFSLFDAECGDSNQEACFYAVLSALYSGDANYQEAKNNITEDSPYSAILLWYEALFYLNRNNKKETVKYLEKLSEAGNYKKDEVSEILKLLTEVK